MSESGMLRVLVVEDDDMVRGFLIRALERGRYEPVGVRTGEVALAVVDGPEPPDVALIDGILPDMHGIRLADAILDRPAGGRIAISFVTGALRESCAPRAGVGALSKPLRLQELLDAVGVLAQWLSGEGSPAAERRQALRGLEQVFLVGA